ncbi:PotD/PotF family extracellular solute-binding protein [Marinibaculum pumilum]|uniref:PotD/PotF family extracellular solute-binding protein n=1 Tax=Marinibaculum pumilum TaxID=1766165 RepID=A0ABV7LAX1_9PROT
MRISRRTFLQGSSAAASLAVAAPVLLGGPRRALAARDKELNILCWEGYNTDDVLGPFRDAHEGITVRAESGTSDPDMINKLRAGEVNVWDLINLNQPWARQQLLPEGLIKPLNKERFMPYFAKMAPEFADPAYPLAFAANGDLIGMPQRYGPFSFVVNTDKISREMAEDQGWKLFLDPKLKDRYGVLTYDNWNLIHMCLTGDLNPFKPLDEKGFATFTDIAKQIFAGSKLLTDDLVR